MSIEKTGESKSYKDPAGELVQAATSARRQREARFPEVFEVYDGFYFMFNSTDKRSASYLAGSEGVIGSELMLQVTPEFVHIVARDGAVIADIDTTCAERLRYRYNRGWIIKTALSLVSYQEAGKRFIAEVACFCYDSALDEASKQALEMFIKNLVYRINKGVHPGLELSQEQFMKVIESKGAWYLTKNTPLPPREKGTIIYKRRRTWSESLVNMSLRGNRGCKVAAIVFWILFAGAIASGIWWLFFR